MARRKGHAALLKKGDAKRRYQKGIPKGDTKRDHGKRKTRNSNRHMT